MTFTRLAAFSALTVLVAGCAGAANPDATQGGGAADPLIDVVAVVDDDTGGIVGIVVDDEVQPIGDAEVVAIGAATEVTMLTAPSGAFAAGHLPPGLYNVSFSKLGYQRGSHSVEVVAGEVTRIQVVMVPVPGQIPYAEVVHKRALIPCSFTLTGGGPCGYTQFTGNIQPVTSQFDGENTRWFHYWSGSGVMTAFNVAEWDRQTAAWDLNLGIVFSYAGRTVGHSYCYGTSGSPNVLRWERDPENGTLDAPQGKCMTAPEFLPDDGQPKTIPIDGITLRTTLNAASMTLPTGQTVPQSFVWQQPVDLWIALFHWMVAPPDYSPIADA